ncbi:PPE domain-containing protein [Streptomyces sp. NPDC053499]|uniref:PPE domain-containing protein n=1 Tax=Streptomyces sp. NPDC053499 TaxID=3365707 RepID=UPI0037D84C46
MSPTPSLAYSDVRNVNLGPLREAVREWGKLPEELRKSITSFNRTVSGPLESSDWKGDAAEAAFKKFRHIRSQMTEAAGEAENIGVVMSEALKAFEDAQEDLKSIEKAVSAKLPDGSESWLKVNPKEGVVHLQSPDGKPVTPGQQKAYHEAIVSYNNRIREILENAAIADKRLKTALQIDPAGKGFNDDIAAHLKDVDKETKEDVDAALKLAQDKGPEMSEKELSRLNGLLAKNAKNADFAEQFATGLGPKGSLDFWYNMALPRTEQRGPSGSVRVDWTKGEAARRAALQDNLGVVMGLASNSNSPEMTQWKKDMLDISMDRIHADEAKGKPYADKGPYNAQVLSNLMRTGKWDSNFLNSYGDKLMDKDQEKAVHNMKNDPPSKWISGGLSDSAFLNFGPKNDAGEDPVTGLMEAFNHNPDASTEFFKDQDHFDYLTKEREWPKDGETADEGKLKDVKAGHQSLAHALTAATTGHEWDAPLEHPPNHTKDQAHVMSELVKGVEAQKGDHIKLEPGMHEAIGRAAAEYTPDLFRAMKEGSGDVKLFPLQGAQADIGHIDASGFLLQLGQDPDANAAMRQAQKLYTSEVLEHHLGGDLPADQRYDATPKETVQEILRASGEVSGTLTIGQQEALVGPAVARDEDFERATLSARLWGNAGFGTAVIPATVKWMSPVSGAVLGTVVTGAESAIAYDIDARVSRHEGIDKAALAAHVYDDAQKRDVEQNETMLKKIEEMHNVDISTDNWAEVFSKEGFDEANTRVQRTETYRDSMDNVKSLPVDRPDS